MKISRCQPKYKDLIPDLPQEFHDDPSAFVNKKYKRGFAKDILNKAAFFISHGLNWWSQQRLADDVNCSRRTVIRWMKVFRKDGLIIVHHRYKYTPQGKRNKTNITNLNPSLTMGKMLLKVSDAIIGLKHFVNQSVTQLNIIENNVSQGEIDTPSYGYRWEELQDVAQSTNILDNWTLNDIRRLAPEPKQKIPEESLRSNEPPKVQSVSDLFASLGLPSGLLEGVF